MNLFYSLLLGIIEGLTEFIPVSSTAHLLIAERIMAWTQRMLPSLPSPWLVQIGPPPRTSRLLLEGLLVVDQSLLRPAVFLTGK